MNHCHVEFTPFSAEALQRTEDILALIADMKREVQDVDEERISELLTPAEKAFFWDPEPLELEEWNQHWKATPVDVRLSPAMVIPQWTLESMYEAFWEGDYEFIGILAEDGKHFLAFEPYGYPYGGISSMIALLECFGHRVIAYDDGTGRVSYTPRETWTPKHQSR
jgi:hypothetical protein